MPFISLVVARGDTLIALSRRLGVPPQQLAADNEARDAHLLRAGSVLKVRAADTRTITVRLQKGDTLSGIATRFRTTVAAIASTNGLRHADRVAAGQLIGVPTHAWRPPTPILHAPWATAPRLASPPMRPPRGGARPLPPSVALRYAAAATSSLDNVLRVTQTKVAAVGIVGGLVAVGRLPNDLHNLADDVAKKDLADAAEDAAKAGRNGLRFVRGIEEVAASFGSRALAHLVPGANVAAAALDVGIAVATTAAAHASTTERLTADVAALASTVSAADVPIVSQVAGLGATAAGLWRDSLADARRAKRR